MHRHAQKNLKVHALILVIGLFFESGAEAYTFPYTHRTRDYMGWSAVLKGDINTVGMGGATVAIPYSISAAESNPAGFAMEISSLSAQINNNTIRDDHLQKTGSTYDANEWGLAVSPPPWGFGVTYYSPSMESGRYTSPNTGNDLDTEVSTKDLRFSLARQLGDNLAVGVSLEILKAIRNLGVSSYNSTALDFHFGVLYRTPGHLVLGFAYTPETTISTSNETGSQSDMPGFDRPVVMPHHLALGAGWIPNRFFKAGVGVHYIAATQNTATLADENREYGGYQVLEPRIGASYVIAEYQNLKIEYAMGSYYEPSRIRGEGSRLHGTLGLEVNPYFINTGIGFDFASGYKNLMVSIGVDLVRTLRTFDIIPKDPVPPLNGFLPKPGTVSADGLPAGLTSGEEKNSAPPSVKDVGNIIKNIPKKIAEKVNPSPTPSPDYHLHHRHHVHRRHKTANPKPGQTPAKE